MIKYFSNILYVLPFLLFFSCDKTDNFTLDVQELSKVSIVTRGAEQSEFDYPIFIYAFSSKGSLVSMQKIESADDDICLNLNSNNEYTIVALSADETVYDIPSSPSLSSVVKIKDGSNCALLYPLQMGSAKIKLGSVDANVNIQLNYQVCSFSATLQALPEETSSPSISVASCYEGVTLDGNLQGETTAIVSCDESSNGSFCSGEVYLFPTCGSQTVFTIKYSDANGDQYSAATYKSTLNSGIPYVINATHTGGLLEITGSITRPKWGDPVDISFTFGSNKEDEADDTPSIDGDVYYVSSIPSRFTVWNGHVIADVLYNNGSTATLLLLSLKEWSNMTSSSNTTSPKLAANTAKEYTENGLDGWEIPDGNQAKLLYNAYQVTDNARTLVGAMSSIEDADPLSRFVRYLCSSAAKTFSFSSSSLLPAGQSTNDYHLRLVREVQVKVKQ